MTQAVAATTDPLMQLLAQCRDQPIVFDDVRAELEGLALQVIGGLLWRRELTTMVCDGTVKAGMLVVVDLP